MSANADQRFAEAVPGDVQIVGRPGGSVWLADSSASNHLEITASRAALTTVSASNVTLNGLDLKQRIDSLSQTPGVGQSNVRAIHVAAESIDTDKVGGILQGDAGGTGAAELTDGGLLAVPQSGGGWRAWRLSRCRPRTGGWRWTGRCGSGAPAAFRGRASF